MLLSASSSHSESSFYLYCEGESQITQLRGVLASNTQPIFLDCEGRDLGRIGGKLGLVQLGIGEDVYLIDVITYPKSLEILKDVLENAEIEKVVWDGRSDFAALWHGHGISMDSILDLQLVKVYISSGGVKGSRGFIKLDGLGKVFESCSRDVLFESGIDLERLANGF